MSDDLPNILRDAIRESGQTLSAIASETGVRQSTLSEFMAGSDMRLATTGKLLEYLGLELSPVKKRRR